MNCREFVEFLMDYLDESLADGVRQTFDQHIRDCPGCGTYLDTYRETVKLGKELCDDPEADVPEDVPERLVSAILAARAAKG